jgi:hypothetical protein
MQQDIHAIAHSPCTAEPVLSVPESDIPMVGNVFSFVLTKYPPEWRWSLIKVRNFL